MASRSTWPAEVKQASDERWQSMWADARKMAEWQVPSTRIALHLQFMLDTFCTIPCRTCEEGADHPCRTVVNRNITLPHRARAVDAHNLHEETRARTAANNND